AVRRYGFVCGSFGVMTSIEGKLLSSGEAVRVVIEDGHIRTIQRIEPESELPWIAPGLVDLQINGYKGIDFNTLPLEPAAVIEATRLLLTQGVTSYYPTVITNSP